MVNGIVCDKCQIEVREPIKNAIGILYQSHRPGCENTQNYFCVSCKIFVPLIAHKNEEKGCCAICKTKYDENNILRFMGYKVSINQLNSTTTSVNLNKNHNIDEIFRDLATQMEKQFTKTLSHVKHPSELGVAREKLLINFLNNFLPKRFGIGSGFVIDSYGGISKQIDIVIYDQIISSPFILPGDIKYYPCEGVVAIGEVKSNINSKKILDDALSKISSVQKLNRFSDKKNIKVAIHGGHGHEDVIFLNNGLPHTHYRILSFIFTSKGLISDTIINELYSYFKNTPINYWPNIIVDFEKYMISYQSANRLELFPDDFIGLFDTKPEEKGKIVLQFACLLANFLSVARVVRPLLLDYLKVGSSNMELHPYS